MTIERMNPSDQRKEIEYNEIQIPLDFARQSRTYQYARLQMELPSHLRSMIDKQYTSQQDRLALLLSIYAAWIYRFSGEHDIVVGTIADRLPACSVLVSIEHAKTFRDLYSAVRRQLDRPSSEGISHPETFLTLNHQLEPPDHSLLNWSFTHNHQRLSMCMEYDVSLFKEPTVQRFRQAYLKLLEAVLADDAVHIGLVPLLSDEELAIYDQLNDTAFHYPTQFTVHRMFEQAAGRFGSRPSISSEEGSYTYEALNERANQVANMLLSKGLRKGDFVTLFMERSLDTIISLLGVLKAGGAYVPVDPEYPEERIRYIIGDTKTGYILTKQNHAERSEQLTASLGTVKEIMLIDGDLSVYAADNPQVSVDPDDLAYVIYTSGSTGQPKGTLLAHRGAVNLGTFICDKFAITEQDVLTQFATFSFDASVWEVISALYAGAHLHLLSAEERVSIEAFADAVAKAQTTIIPAVPTVFFNQLAVRLSDAGFRKLASVRSVMIAGEALYGEQVRAFQTKSNGQIDIYNLYGPTECTVGTTFHRISEPIPEKLTHIPIGTPNGNYRVYIVNQELQLCPLNVPGELLIASVGLAKGYLNQSLKTAEAFIPSPFNPDEMVYKSGDIVKLLEDGTIEYVTRRDSQVKIRGHRIEIGAIEDYLTKYPNIQDTAVIPVKEPGGQQALVGYYTTKDGSPLPASLIRTFLHDKLPAYYVPKWLVQLEEMPLSPTGKVERKKLAGYEFEQNEEQTFIDETKRPATEYQKLIAAAWEANLGKKQLSIEDDFFEIGGDSLGVIQVLVHLKPYCLQLAIQDLFQYKTMEQLAKRMEQLDQEVQYVRERSRPKAIKVLHEYPRIEQLAGASENPANVKEAAYIVLTGATGYLGSHILYELLKKSSAQVIALIRHSPGQSAYSRLQDVMLTYFGDSLLELMKERVQVIEGDLSTPGLGLSTQDWERISGHMDTIIHAAADVRHFGSAEQFEQTNVRGTQHLIELAESKPGIQFHHISTIAIPEDLALNHLWDSVEQLNDFSPNLHLESVYSSSKLAAEKLVLAAAKRGLAVSIYRPANLTCHSVTGKFQTNIDSNAFYRMLKAMLLLGKAPEADWLVDLTPIDYASSSIVELVLKQDAIGHMFHICNPNPIPYSKLIQYVNEMGYQVETMPFDTYTRWLLDPNYVKNQEALALAMAQLEGDGAKDSEFQYGCELTLSYLGDSDFKCAASDFVFIQKLISYAVHIGYFPVPQKRREPSKLLV
ncbi:non-ribosomal peptide synthetase family protein [Paenibacillus alba]|uniref:Amino acid adenylation domain-containing protein n=1 Tax=Paenibacillus alba TaxID=1197127 RepID=A0ABU6GCU1_9BACL|nr:amino acid adenylation domain-containing protein [Paenibacillus alba]MEC0230608.1 amino acid adenylation domain-containing protein [Paenibacillus alba]